MEKYLNEMEEEVVIEDFDKNIKLKEENTDNLEELYLTQIKGHENAIKLVQEALDVAQARLDFFRKNPMPSMVRYEYEKEPEFLKIASPFEEKRLQAEVDGIKKPIGSSRLQIDLLKAKLSELKGE